MRILLNRKPVDGPWGGGNLLVRALCEFLPKHGFKIVFRFEDKPDVILMLDPRPGNTGIGWPEISEEITRTGVRVFHRVNECDARKDPAWASHPYQGDIDRLLWRCSQKVYATVFVSQWMRDYHLSNSGYAEPFVTVVEGGGLTTYHHRETVPVRAYHGGYHYVVQNGVDFGHFRRAGHEMGFKVKIVTHHWSDNFMKGKDVYEWIDRFVGEYPDEFEFTYIGRHQCDFKNTQVVPPLFGQELGNELRKYDVYVSGSRFDPGPNHVVESISCGLPTYVHKDGGGAVEFAGESHVYDSLDSLEKILQAKKFACNSSTFDSWEKMVEKYVTVLKME